MTVSGEIKGEIGVANGEMKMVYDDTFYALIQEDATYVKSLACDQLLGKMALDELVAQLREKDADVVLYAIKFNMRGDVKLMEIY